MTEISGNEKPNILVVDDQKINRMILRNILSSEYGIYEAENGREALQILDEHLQDIQAVLLDLVMPVMNGFEFLSSVRTPQYATLPILVLTGEADSETEKRVLDAGAWDFIAKPYQPVILTTRLKNALARSQMGMFEKMKSLAEHDSLTGLYNRSNFFYKTSRLIALHPDITFSFVRMDIDQFSLINSFWGEEEGDRLLKYIADCFRSELTAYDIGTFGHINSDIFCFCVPYVEEKLLSVTDHIRKSLLHFKVDYFIKPTFGVYIIRDSDQTVETMYEKAAIASKACKGFYNKYISYYDRKSHEELKWERQVTSQMQQALDAGQFIPWMQPKYSLKSEKPCGAEALVRWNHPELGILSPAKFVPIFERNGFISKVDFAIWDSVAGTLRRWLDEGRDPLPISVNVSLVDLYNPAIVQIMSDLIKKHNIPAGLLNLELTESVYMDNPAMMKKIITDLHSRGFVIMMDDFGSGYSSLNALKEIPVDILKIDMNFLRDAEGSSRSRRILASMILMAGWLNLPVVVEGVETRSQVDFLKSVGCNFVQGYFFGKPMPEADYEALMEKDQAPPEVPADSVPVIGKVWDLPDDSASFLYHFSFPAAVYEFTDHHAYPIRVNQALNDFFGYQKNSIAFHRENESFSEADMTRILGVCEAFSADNPSSVLETSYTDSRGGAHDLFMMLNYLGTLDERKIFSAFFALDKNLTI